MASEIDAAIVTAKRPDDRFCTPNWQSCSLPFNWVHQSNNGGFGWAMAAGDQLFARIAEQLHIIEQVPNHDDIRLHLIGHSLGGNTISQAAGRLIQHGFKVEQMTFLDAVQSYSPVWPIPVPAYSNYAIRAWAKIPKVDNYFGTGVFFPPKTCEAWFPVGKLSPAETALDRFVPNTAHTTGCFLMTAIYDAYRESITDPSHHDHGWAISPLGPKPWTFVPQGQRVSWTGAELVVNGDFEWENAAGYQWTNDGAGYEDGISNVDIARRTSTDYAAAFRASEGKPSILRHAPIYIPDEESTQLTYDYAISATGSNELSVSAHVTGGGQAPESLSCTHQVDGRWHTAACSLPLSYVGKRVELRFDFKSHRTRASSEAPGWVDNIHLGSFSSGRIEAAPVIHQTTSSGIAFAIKSDTTQSAVVVRDIDVVISNDTASSWSVAVDEPWVDVSPQTLNGGGGTVAVAIDVAALTEGVHVAQLAISQVGDPFQSVKTVPIIVRVVSPETRTIDIGGGATFSDGTRVVLVNASGAENISAVSLSGPPIALPSRLMIPSSSFVHQLATTDSFVSAVITFSYDPSSAVLGAQPVLLRVESGAGVVLPSTVDFFKHTVTATVSALGEFVVAFSQAAGCEFNVSASVWRIPAAGGNFSANISVADQTCFWAAVPSADFLAVSGSAVRSGNGTFTVSVGPNASVARTGFIEVAGTVITVEQAAAPVPPVVTVNPLSRRIPPGRSWSFSIAAATAESYQWQVSQAGSSWMNLVDGAPYGGVTTPTLSVTNASRALSGSQFRCLASNGSGSVASNAATLTVTASPGDFDGDGSSDVAIYRPAAGMWYVLKSAANFAGGAGYAWGADSDVPVPADYDGDGRTDVAVYRPSTAHWFILKSTSDYSTWATYQWGSTGDVPVPGDYDGDGKSDIAIYRPSAGMWYILKSSTNFVAGDGYQWGAGSDIPVPGDFDGDGRTDIAVHRPSSGHWFILTSTTNYSGFGTYQWGTAGDLPVTSDYDGDGKADIAIYRPSSGAWYILKSSTGFTGGDGYFWGASSDVPVPGDYDGDGRSDIVVYRPSTAHWFILRSTSDYKTWATYQWGSTGDIPMLKRP
jgi:hypothetical protein